ncbi:MAG: hypothetical protein H6617_06820 [Bdellovibrionaceae bacterium]|nr:hypothetical protein [Bdellovibrionales bacterium]MCB9254378.1 hypothetical protein [Pseudobdellovibrionaceae bacterium]
MSEALKNQPDSGAPDFERLVQKIIESVDKAKLAEMRRDFHTRLRITLNQPDNTGLIEDLWDYFYDWCFFEHNLPETIETLSGEEAGVWKHVKVANQRGLYSVQKTPDTELKLKELYTGEIFWVKNLKGAEQVAFSKGDFLEARLVGDPEASKKQKYLFLRKPSYHPAEVHPYIKTKIKTFKRNKDFSTYQNWLWLLVGMYLKHRLYSHLPIEKIYDDNSRI